MLLTRVKDDSKSDFKVHLSHLYKTSKEAVFLLQLCERDTIPFERCLKGLVFYVKNRI